MVRRLVNIILLTSSPSPTFEWPTTANIRKVQDLSIAEAPTKVELRNELYHFQDACIRIPENATDLQLRIWIIGHRGASRLSILVLQNREFVKSSTGKQELRMRILLFMLVNNAC